MNIIGVTGPSGAGKSLLGSYISSLGVPSIDADRVYHSLLIPPSECLDSLRSVFGDRIFNSDGSLDRAALGKIVFSDPHKLELLNQTVLPRVLNKIRALIDEYQKLGHLTVVLDGPTLIESGFDKECDTVISVLCDKSLRIDRITSRDNISREKAEARINAQHDDSFYIENSDYILYNNENAETFISQAEQLLKDIII